MNGGFSYALTLVSNSRLWDLKQKEGLYCPLPGTQPLQYVLCFKQEAWPSHAANAGFGWGLTLGRLLDPSDTGLHVELDDWTYESPDGAMHTFKGPLHPDDAGGAATHTRDGSYLRMKAYAAPPGGVATRTVESPDGTIRTFENITNGWTAWRLQKIEDRHGNLLEVDYDQTCDGDDELDAWTITDNTTDDGSADGRRHQICLHRALQYVTKVSLLKPSVGAAAAAEYTFNYFMSQREIAVTPEDDVPDNPETYMATLLKEVVLPDGTKYSMVASDGQPDYYMTGTSGGQMVPSSAPKRVVLPTGGSVAWTFKEWWYQAKAYYGDGGCSQSTLFPNCWPDHIADSWPGIWKRIVTDADGTTTRTWEYYSRAVWHTDMPIPSELGYMPEERRTIVTDPALNDTVHYFRSVPRELHYTNPAPTAPAEDCMWPDLWDHNLPYTRRNQADATSSTLSRLSYCNFGS